MKKLKYNKGTMYDFFMREDLKREDLFPMVYALSSGQKSLSPETGLWSLVNAISAEFVNEGDLADKDVRRKARTISIYEGEDEATPEPEVSEEAGETTPEPAVTDG